MGEYGELNVGQLMRERHGADSVSVGFTTYSGTVTAASDWDAPAERKTVRPALPHSYEQLFHETGTPRFLLPLRDDKALADALTSPRLERAIGVVYKPETERDSHYFQAHLARAVRLRAAFRRNDRARAARANGGVDGRGTGRNLSVRLVSGAHTVPGLAETGGETRGADAPSAPSVGERFILR